MPFEIVRNDITKMKTDAIVNAANSSLAGGGGVDGAIHSAAGPLLTEECMKLGGCPVGEVRITGGYRLPARYVIHTVGPVWQGGDRGEKALLASCYARSLELAKKRGCESIAFPLISAGAYGYPREEAMEVAVEEISRFLLKNDMMVYLVVFGRESFFTGKKIFRDIQAYIDDTYVEEHLDESRERGRWLSNLSRPVTGARRVVQETVCPEESFEAAAKRMDRDMDLETAAKPDYMDGVCGAMPDWDALLRQQDEGFAGMLLRLIDERGMTDSACYKKANVDRKLFSKIRSRADYHPSKPTVLAFAVALELDLEETRELLRKAGFALSRSSKFDIILEYFINHGMYNIYEINEVLFGYDLPLLGNGGAA